MVNRTNTVTGVKYSEDPTIFSWNVLNEPRFFYNYSKCHDDPQFCRNKLYSWIKETSSHLKSIDSNHLVSIGYEGFFAPSSQYSKANPSGGWVKYTGQDFENDTALSTIDYAEIHLWVDNWDVAGNNGFIKTWINDHEKAAQKLGKPLVMEEFGKNTTNPFDEQLKDQQVRNQTFSTVMSYLTDSLNSGGVLRGAVYWMWDPVIQSTNSPGYNKYGQDQVPVNGSTFQNIIVPAASKAASKNGTVQSCSNNSTSSAGRKLRWV